MTTTIDHLPPTATQQLPSTEHPGPENLAPADQDGPTWADFRDLEQRVQRVQQRTNRRDAWTTFTMVFAAVAVLFGVMAIGLGSRAVSESKRNTAAPTIPATPVAAAPAAGVLPVAVTLADMRVVPMSTTIAAGQVTLHITNTGMMLHELLIFRSDLAPAAYPMSNGDINEDGPGITKISDGENLNPGASQTRVVDFSQPGTYLLVCNLPGHFKMGMYSVVTVK